MRPLRPWSRLAPPAIVAMLAAMPDTPLEAQQRGASDAAAAATAAAADAAAPLTICYTPLLGIFYLIEQPGLAQSCLTIGGVQHVRLSWDRTGPTGDKGATGAAGPPGAVGSPGEQGEKGPDGPAGPPGTQGDKGAAGDVGVTGAIGERGPPGAAGLQGPPGPQGNVGLTGASGDKGAAGAVGVAGPPGEPGDKGVRGDKGETGDKGPQGVDGEPGDKGATGAPGPDGPPGPQGDKGPTGDEGPVGLPGPDGVGVPCDACVTTPVLANLAVTNEKLAPISAAGKIANTATSATSANLANRIVARDANGAFAAGVTSADAIDLVGSFAALRQGNTRMLYRMNAQPDASVYLGVAAGSDNPGQTATRSVGLGSGAMQRATTGSSSVAIGLDALNGGSSARVVAIGGSTYDNGFFPGTDNVVIGAQSARAMSADGPSSPRGNIVLGFQAATNILTHSNVIAIGRTTIGGSSRIEIGNPGAPGTSLTHQRAFIAGIFDSPVTGVQVTVGTNWQLGVLASSARFKLGVRDMGDAGDLLSRLRPVSWRYRVDIDRSSTLQYGLIAEDVARVAPELVVFDDERRPFTVRYELLVPLLVSEVQQRRARLELLQQRSDEIRRRIEQLESMVKP